MKRIYCFLVLFLWLNRYEGLAQVFNIPNGDVNALAQAIISANGDSFMADTINLAPNGTYILTAPAVANVTDNDNIVQGAVGLPLITRGARLVINGNGATIQRANNAPLFRIMYVQGQRTDITINNLTFSNGHTTGQGGGLYVSFKSRITLNNCKFIGNRCTISQPQGGGGLAVKANSELMLNGCEFRNNETSDSCGGGVCSVLSNITVLNCLFVNNKVGTAGTKRAGGGLYIDGTRGNTGIGTIARTVFDANSGGAGGGLHFCLYNQQQGSVDRSIFRNNIAPAPAGCGGGMWTVSLPLINPPGEFPYTGGSNTYLRVTNTTFHHNTAVFLGGGLACADSNDGKIDIYNCTFAHNRAQGPNGQGIGGGVNITRNDLTLTNCTFAHNYAEKIGGAIGNNINPENVKLYNCILAHNYANNSGASRKLKHNCDELHVGSNNMQFPGLGDSPADRLCNADIVVADPRLAPLADYGSGIPTMPLMPNSPAINAGRADLALPYDQRTTPRNGAVDLGAFEYHVGTATSPSLAQVEGNFTVVQEAGVLPVSILANPAMSGGAAVRLPDVGDRIRITLNIPQAGYYQLRVRLRAGNTANSPTIFFTSGYIFRLNNHTVSLMPEAGSLSELIAVLSGTYMGVMHTTWALPAGTHQLSIEARRGNALVDSWELAPVPMVLGDNQAPTAPTLSTTELTTNSVRLNWTPASDDSTGAIEYLVYLNNTVLNVTTQTSHLITELSPAQDNFFRVLARDAVGNLSVLGSRANVVTLSPVVSGTLEAENIYQVVKSTAFAAANTATTTLNATSGISTSVNVQTANQLSANKAVGILNVGDQIALNFPISASGKCRLRLRVRTGNTSHAHWYLLNNAYRITLDGKPVQFHLDSATALSGLNNFYGLGARWGVIQLGDTILRLGNHTLLIEARQSAIGIDFLQVVEYYDGLIDETAPCAPELSLANVGIESASLQWRTPTDNRSQSFTYEVYRGNTLLATLSDTLYTATNLLPLTSYHFSVMALDAAGNRSFVSNQVTALTLSPTPLVRLEAESIYSVLLDVSTSPISVTTGSNLSNSRAVRMPEIGERIRLPFTITGAGNYILRLRVRSGSNANPTGLWNNGYTLTLNEDALSFVANANSIEASSANGGTFWGMMQASAVYLTSGTYNLDITALKKGASVDYLEIQFVPPVSTNSAQAMMATHTTNPQPIAEAKETPRAQIASVYPNPFTGERLTVQFHHIVAGKVQATLRAADGSLLWQDSIHPEGDGSAAEFYISQALRPGVYLLTLCADNLSAKTVRIIKQ